MGPNFRVTNLRKQSTCPLKETLLEYLLSVCDHVPSEEHKTLWTHLVGEPLVMYQSHSRADSAKAKLLKAISSSAFQRWP